MSLLEDIFLQDEANEARELERVIEGGDYDERPRSESPSGDDSDNNSRKDDEAEEDKRRVDPSSTKTKKVVKNPRFILNPARLTGPRGIQVIPEHFKDFKFKDLDTYICLKSSRRFGDFVVTMVTGKGHEKEDLDMVLKKLEHWAYRLYPKFQFEDCLKKIETLGKKRPVMVHLHKIRTDQILSEETVVQNDSSDDEVPQQEEDEFDKLLQQQIELARATPAPESAKKTSNEQWQRLVETPQADRSHTMMPKATSSPSISDEQKERMLKNRKLAEERRLARLKLAANSINTNITITDENMPKESHNINENEENQSVSRKSNRSNVIDSSDSEDDNNIQNKQSIEVDIHTNITKNNVLSDEITENDVKTNTELMIIDEGSDKNENINTEITNNDKDVISIEDCNDIEKSNDKIQIVNSEIATDNVIVNAANDNKIHDSQIVEINDEIETENVIEIDQEMNTDEKIDKTEVSNQNNKEIDNNEIINNSNTDGNLESAKISSEEVVDDFADEIMDVDFSEEF